MNIFQLECFLAVADYLSFAKAAERMKISQPAVTHQIQSLERELGVKLFRRTTRSVAMTVEGLAFLDDARDIVSRSQRAMRRFKNADDQEEILELSIGCTSISLLERLPEVLRELKSLYPNLHPQILINPGVQIFARVVEGTIDIALGPKNAGTKKDALIYRELKKLPLMCAFRSDHPFAQKDIVTEEDIAQHNLILYLPGSAAPELRSLQDSLSTLKSPSELHFCESAETALILVRAGFGVTILPDIVEEHPNIKKCPLADAKPISWGYYYKTVKDNAPLKDFIQLLKQQEAPAEL